MVISIFIKFKFQTCFLVCHAGMNAIVHASGSTKGATLYTTHFPCNTCAKIIVENGITKVVYFSDIFANDKKVQASKNILNACDVKMM